MEVRRIFHIVGCGRNYGDLAIQLGIQDRISFLARRPIEFIPIDLKMNKPIDLDVIDNINLLGDMLIIGGGGMLMRGDGFDTESGWQLNINPNLLKHINVPIVVYSIGYNSFPNEDEILSNTRVVESCKILREKAVLFSVRDTGTKRLLESAGIENIEVVPDPAIMCPHIVYDFDGISLSDLCIGFNWAGDRYKERYGNTDPEKIFSNICMALKNVLYEYGGGKIVFLPHVYIYDSYYRKLFLEIFQDSAYDTENMIRCLYPETLHTTSIFVSLYSRLNCCVGVRGHSAILSYATNTPFVSIGGHLKNKFFCDDIGGRIVDYDDPDFVNDLSDAILDCMSPSSMSRMAFMLRESKNKVDNFNHRILKILDDI